MLKTTFVQITKVDATKREVSGILTEEVTDKAKEKMDYATSKPLFQKWSGAISKATEGKSLGNVREMHQAKAVGKFTEILFNDTAKQIVVTAKIVDDAAWTKCDEGVYTGFSIGGNVVGKMWDDPDEDGVKRYTVDPVEGSVVDNPCLGTAHFTAVKADGVTEDRTFKVWTPTMEDVAAKAQEIATTKGGGFGDHMEAAKAELIAAKGAEVMDASKDDPFDKKGPEHERTNTLPIETVVPDDLAHTEEVAGDPPGVATAGGKESTTGQKAAAGTDWGIVQVFRVAADDSVHDSKAAAKEHVTALKTLEANGSPLAAAIAKAKAAAAGEVEGGGAAVAQVTTFENSRELKVVGKLLGQAAGADGVAKGMYGLGEMARVVDRVADLQMMTAWEEAYRADGGEASTVPAALADAVKQLGETLLTYAKEEVAYLMSNMKDGAGDPIEMILVDEDGDLIEAAAQALTAIKADTGLMEKAGRRNSAKDQKHVQDAHDSSVKAGATCSADNLDKTATATIEKLTTENAGLQKQIADALPDIETLTKAMTDMQAELSVLKAQPAPMPQIPTSGARLAQKTDDTRIGGAPAPMTPGAQAEMVADLVKAVGIDKVRDMMIAAAQQNPLPVFLRGGAGDA